MNKVVSIAKTVIKYLPVILAAWAAYQQIRKVTTSDKPAASSPAAT